MRFIDGNADYQTGAVTVRTGGSGGGVDLDLPAVCAEARARAAAERALEADGERLTAALGPLEALRLEPGDGVRVEGRDGVWRVARIDWDETPRAVLEPVSGVQVGEDEDAPGAGEGPAAVGAPFLRMIELPPLVGSEADGRPIAVVAGEPWRAMKVWAGASAEALTARGEVMQPATVGVLTEALGPGARHRWDEVNTLTVRVEGRAPESRGEAAVFAGANTVAVETEAGFELVQYRTETVLGEGVWRLSGLLRGQQGTDAALAAGAAAGALVVLLDAQPTRVELAAGERGLPLVWRAGPLGGPAGGAGTSEVGFTATGVQARPWAPAHLRALARTDGGRDLSWVARSRLDGDRWDGEATGSDPLRFRVRVVDGETIVRRWEVEGVGALYAAPGLAGDFPGGPGGVVVGVAQWGEGYGWGSEARAELV